MVFRCTHYTVGKWPPSFKSVGFGETEYSQILKAHSGYGKFD